MVVNRSKPIRQESHLYGKAIGGLYDGHSLAMPVTWDGRIRNPRTATYVFLPGAYRWNTDIRQWVWHDDNGTTVPDVR